MQVEASHVAQERLQDRIETDMVERNILLEAVDMKSSQLQAVIDEREREIQRRTSELNRVWPVASHGIADGPQLLKEAEDRYQSLVADSGTEKSDLVSKLVQMTSQRDEAQGELRRARADLDNRSRDWASERERLVSRTDSQDKSM